MADSQDMQGVIEKLSERKFSDDHDFSGALPKKRKRGDHSNVFREGSQTFYALALPQGQECVEGRERGNLVFQDMKEALLKLRHYKGSRLKSFPNEEEAITFTSTSSKVVNLSDKYRTSVTPQMLIRLRKTIRNGDAKAFAEMVWRNPRILIGKADYPSVLQEISHENAIHVTAECNQPIMCQLILDILQNQRFLKKLYHREKPQMIQKRKNRLLDLYLNTPDKVLGDTPLHYASKFGSLECVIILIAHELSIPDSKNKNGKTPAEIICSCSKQADGASIAKIQAAFKCIFYVTIMRDDNFLSPPVVGRPSLRRNVFDEIRPDIGAHDILNETALKIKAFAGPMTKEKAECFYQLLKYPSSVSLGNFMYRNQDLILLQKIRRTDSEKGLERIARLLAADFNVVYMEYFPMLNLFTNLSKKEGLLILEKHINGLPNSYPENIVLPSEESVVAAYLEPKAHVNSLGHDINVHLRREQYKKIISSKEQFFTAPSSPDSDCEYVLAPPDKFIEGGFSMTRHDVDALLAVCSNNVCVDEQTFPLVYRWKNRVEEKLREYQDNLKEMKRLTPLASIVIPRVVYIDAPTAATLVPEQD